MLRFRRVVDGAAKHVEHAAIHVLALAPAQLGVKRFGIAAAKRGDVGDAEAAQIGGYRGADAGDPLQVVLCEMRYLSDHTDSSFPLGSVKWKRRPPGNENIGLTMVPPALRIFSSMPARSAE